ncbi:hypothetical protein G7B40_040290 [Aetokthonos hydrillicola Thurmond2011]|uniref:ASCH domain-containing protein n=1 Tax=Aetokthonos hydrillicola Thurmond2011 TaxID=2712845 RepID=A0AAP5IFQ2_9CYAN|nr:hypothetical protein [Aetokthonos hydrillicola]MBO3459969.1 hypothetical protein [Aetokthonos hydrillicola CCALA 1050]MBW4584088.1 hypothetical protein [Aetokthonos hydrillicola CCALA 1050]MDR9900730.1 hypothetical protein [Aetokthonos hydrillicola Thurmond2011]
MTPSNLRAISIHAPFAYAICLGLKDEEYRTQPTLIRGWILIHSSQSKASDQYFTDYGIDIANALGGTPEAIAKRGAIIGACKLTDCIGSPGDYAYCLKSPILFDKPIEGIRGQQSIFWGISDKFPERLEAFKLAWGMINH